MKTTTVYQIREATFSNNPADAGRLIKEFDTYRKAEAYWRQAAAKGREVFISRVEVEAE